MHRSTIFLFLLFLLVCNFNCLSLNYVFSVSLRNYKGGISYHPLGCSKSFLRKFSKCSSVCFPFFLSVFSSFTNLTASRDYTSFLVFSFTHLLSRSSSSKKRHCNAFSSRGFFCFFSFRTPAYLFAIPSYSGLSISSSALTYQNKIHCEEAKKKKVYKNLISRTFPLSFSSSSSICCDLFSNNSFLCRSLPRYSSHRHFSFLSNLSEMLNNLFTINSNSSNNTKKNRSFHTEQNNLSESKSSLKEDKDKLKPKKSFNNRKKNLQPNSIIPCSLSSRLFPHSSSKQPSSSSSFNSSQQLIPNSQNASSLAFFNISDSPQTNTSSSIMALVNSTTLFNSSSSATPIFYVSSAFPSSSFSLSSSTAPPSKSSTDINSCGSLNISPSSSSSSLPHLHQHINSSVGNSTNQRKEEEKEENQRKEEEKEENQRKEEEKEENQRKEEEGKEENQRKEEEKEEKEENQRGVKKEEGKAVDEGIEEVVSRGASEMVGRKDTGKSVSNAPSFYFFSSSSFPSASSSNPFFDKVARLSPNEYISKFMQTAPPRVKESARFTVLALIGTIPRYAVETIIITTQEKLNNLILQFLITGYMFKNAEYRLTLSDFFKTATSALPLSAESEKNSLFEHKKSCCEHIEDDSETIGSNAKSEFETTKMKDSSLAFLNVESNLNCADEKNDDHLNKSNNNNNHISSSSSSSSSSHSSNSSSSSSSSSHSSNNSSSSSHSSNSSSSVNNRDYSNNTLNLKPSDSNVEEESRRNKILKNEFFVLNENNMYINTNVKPKAKVNGTAKLYTDHGVEYTVNAESYVQELNEQISRLKEKLSYFSSQRNISSHEPLLQQQKDRSNQSEFSSSSASSSNFSFSAAPPSVDYSSAGSFTSPPLASAENSTQMLLFLKRLNEVQIKSLTDNMDPKVIDAMRRMSSLVVEGIYNVHIEGKENTSAPDAGNRGFLQQSGNALVQMCLWQLAVGYDLREIELKDEFKILFSKG